MDRRHSLIFAMATLAACGTSPRSTSAPSSASPVPATRAAAPTASATSGVAPSGAAERPFTVRNVEAGAIELDNDKNEPVRVAFELDLEREVDGHWESTHVSNMLMQTTCSDSRPADGCATLPAHGAFRPLPWRGWFGCTQCLSCRANVPAAPGRYRIVAHGCGASASVASEPLVVTGEGVVEDGEARQPGSRR